MPTTPPATHEHRRWPREEYTCVEPLPVVPSDEPVVQISVSVLADLQDSLLVAMNDLKRLEGLLDHATANLLDRFNSTLLSVEQLPDAAQRSALQASLHQAVTELQFHDMSSQLLVHIGKVLKGCAYVLADQALAPDADESGLVVTHMPRKPNPVTQSEMDAGSVELF
ncbi:MAG: hypothetical protein AB1735_05945 [Pseudomonadota bacterium]|jgi:hypothetical protein